jgi:phosphate transport system permease protein
MTEADLTAGQATGLVRPAVPPDPAIAAATTLQQPPVVVPPPAPYPPHTPNGSSRPDVPRPIGAKTLDDTLSVIGSIGGSFGLTWLFAVELLPIYGWFAFLVTWYLVFLGLYATVSSLANPWTQVKDRLIAALVRGGAGVVGAALLTAVAYTYFKGFPALIHLNQYVETMDGVAPTAPLSRGGVAHAIVGSLMELLIATAVALPLGVATAVYITEVKGRLARVVRTIIEAMTGLPDILAGLFVYIVLIHQLGLQKSGFAAGVALGITMLPIIARASEVVLRVVPGGLREAGLALGATQWQTVWRVVLPTARPGLATALVLGMARAIGETAPLILVSGATTLMVVNPFPAQMNSLPLFIYTGARSGEPDFIARAFGAAGILLALVLVLFAVTRWLARTRVGNR